jgi:hypothetical protein
MRCTKVERFHIQNVREKDIAAGKGIPRDTVGLSIREGQDRSIQISVLVTCLRLPSIALNELKDSSKDGERRIWQCAMPFGTGADGTT